MAYGVDIKSFISYVEGTNYEEINFHNLAFDGDFIISYLLNNGYKVNQDEALLPKQFSTLISNMGQYYSLKVKFPSGKLITFIDSLKKLNMSVANIAKSFNLSLNKLEIDYHENREVGHKLTDEEVDYLANDVIIVSQALAQVYAEGDTKMTIGSDSLENYKKMRKEFDTLYPILPLELDDQIRWAYRGGWTYLKKGREQQIWSNGSVYDINSLYPSVMMYNKLPYGNPILFEGKPDKDMLFIVSITFTAHLKEGHLPCIQIKGHALFLGTEYLEHIPEPETMSVTSVDLELWQKHYDMNILSWNGGFYFHSATGYFDDYINHYMAIKEKATGGKRLLAKLHLNSLYGKFASRPRMIGKYPTLTEEGVIKLLDGKEEVKEPIYTPLSVFITAYARLKTITIAQNNYDRFVYADTDSHHILGEPVNYSMEIHPTKLGASKREYGFRYGLYWRSKAYIDLTEDNKYEVHIAGLPKYIANDLKFADFYHGNVIQGKLRAKRVKGGTVLVDTPYELKL